jgi:hypothetical protein
MHLILYLVRALCVLVSIVLLLIVFVGPAYAGQDVNALADPIHPEGEPDEEPALIFLALVGGTAILAGGVWMAKLRDMLSRRLIETRQTRYPDYNCPDSSQSASNC